MIAILIKSRAFLNNIKNQWISLFSATSLSKTSILNNRNTLNNKYNSENLANGHNSNIINNNSNNLQGDTSLEEISPWLVKDNMIMNKKMDKSKIPLLKTVITTELW